MPDNPLTCWGLPAPQEVNLQDYADLRFPDLLRGMDCLVIRPVQTLSPIMSWLAWRIRWAQSRIENQPLTSWQALWDRSIPSHAMTYAGMGRLWSQDSTFGMVNLKDYRGCTLIFFDPQWTMAERNALMGEACTHAGDSYAYEDIWGLFLWAITGSERAREKHSDLKHEYCSEACCVLKQKVTRDWLGGVDPSNVTPLRLLKLHLARESPAVVIRFT